MTTVAEIAEPLAGICVPVPAAGVGVCLRCHNHPRSDFPTCWSCAETERQVSHPCRLVVPVSLYAIPSQLHHYLRNYKGGRLPAREQDFSLKVAALLCHFLGKHRSCIAGEAGAEWEAVTSVPSSGDRQGEHPFVRAMRYVPSFFEAYRPLLARGSVAVSHNNANDAGFQVTHDVRGRRVLLVDDTYTSGARAQSAASALSIAGARVVAIVPVGRVITPSAEHVTDWWRERLAERFTFDTCCLDRGI